MRFDAKTCWALTAGAMLLAAGLPDVLQAGALAWDGVADDVSGSMMALGASAVPLLVGAGAISAFAHFASLTTTLVAGTGASVVVANGSVLQPVVGGGGGGMITDIVVGALSFPMLA